MRVYFGNKHVELDSWGNRDDAFQSKVKIPKNYSGKLVVKALPCEGKKIILQKSKVVAVAKTDKTKVSSKPAIKATPTPSKYDNRRTLKWFKSTRTYKNMSLREWIKVDKTHSLLLDMSNYYSKVCGNWAYSNVVGWHKLKEDVTVPGYKFKKINNVWYYTGKEKVSC